MRNSVLVLFLTFLAATAAANPPAGYPFLRFDEALRQGRAESKPVFVYFGRYGCAYCDKTNKEAFSDSVVRENFTRNYVLAYVDAESGRRIRLPSGERTTERELGRRYDAAVTPIFSFMIPDGTDVLRLVGLQTRDDLLAADRKIQEALGRVAQQ